MRWSIIILMSLSLACSKKEGATPEPEPPEPPTEAAQPSAEAAPAQAADEPPEIPEAPEALKGETPAVDASPIVTVLDAGGEPRRLVRGKARAGLKQQVTVDVGQQIRAVIAVINAGSPLVLRSYDIAAEAKNAGPDGTVRVEFQAEGTGADPRTPDPPKKTRQLSGRYTLGSDGEITDFTVEPSDAGADANARLVRWSMLQVTPMFPKEPIGVGAEWTIRRGILQGGALVHQLTTLRLTKLEEDRVELSVALEQSASPQPFKNPMTGQSMKLHAIGAMGSGTLTLDLNRLAPTRAEVEVAVTHQASVEQMDRSTGTMREVPVALFTTRTVGVTGP